MPYIKIHASQSEVEDYFVSCDSLGMIVIQMKHDLRADRHYKINIKYSRSLGNDASSGIFREKYFKSLDSSGAPSYGYYIISNFGPLGARHVFPCFDEPNYPATFKFDIVRENGEKVFFNTPFGKKSPFAKGAAPARGDFGLSKVVQSHEIDQFELTTALPSFLVGFVVGHFKTQSIVVEGITIRLSTMENVDDRHLVDALEHISQLVSNFKSYIGTLHHLVELRIVALPNYQLKNYLLQPTQIAFLPIDVAFSSCRLEQRFAFARILAHQIYAPEIFLWWDHLWQESGIVNYLAKQVLSQSERDFITITDRHRMFHFEKFISLKDMMPMNETEVQNTVTIADTRKWGFLLGMFKVGIGLELKSKMNYNFWEIRIIFPL